MNFKPSKYKLNLQADRTLLVHSTDWHIGEPYRFDARALNIMLEHINSRPEELVHIMTGDMVRGHPYGHKYRDEEEDAAEGYSQSFLGHTSKPKTVVEQLDVFAQILRRLKVPEGHSVLTEGNHEQTIFRKMGDVYNSELFGEFLTSQGKLPYYAGFEVDGLFRWDDGTEFAWWAAHGGRMIGGAAGGQGARLPVFNANLKMALAKLCVSVDGNYPLHDGYFVGHNHRQISYEPSVVESDVSTTHDLGLRSILGDPFVCSEGGCYFRSGVCPHGDYQRRSMYRPYEVGWTEMLFDGDHWQRVVRGNRVRKVRFPVSITTYNVKADGTVKRRLVEL